MYEEGELSNNVFDKGEGNGVFMEMEALEKRMSSNDTSLNNTQNECSSLSLDKEPHENCDCDTEAIGFDRNGEEDEMIELPTPSTEESSLQENRHSVIKKFVTNSLNFICKNIS